MNGCKRPFFRNTVWILLPYSAWAGQVLFSQINLGQDKDSPPSLRIHLTDQVSYDAAFCIHTAILWQTRNVTGYIIKRTNKEA